MQLLDLFVFRIASSVTGVVAFLPYSTPAGLPVHERLPLLMDSPKTNVLVPSGQRKEVTALREIAFDLFSVSSGLTAKLRDRKGDGFLLLLLPPHFSVSLILISSAEISSLLYHQFFYSPAPPSALSLSPFLCPLILVYDRSL